MNEKNIEFFYGIIGAYLVYLAYDMFRDGAAQSEMSMMIFCILFLVAGIILLVVTIFSFRKIYREMTRENEENDAADTRDAAEEKGE